MECEPAAGRYPLAAKTRGLTVPQHLVSQDGPRNLSYEDGRAYSVAMGARKYLSVGAVVAVSGALAVHGAYPEEFCGMDARYACGPPEPRNADTAEEGQPQAPGLYGHPAMTTGTGTLTGSAAIVEGSDHVTGVGGVR